MEFRRADTKPGRLAADFVERDQASVTIEQAVLDRLRGDRAAQLLESGIGFSSACVRRSHDLQRLPQLWCNRFGFGQRGRQRGGQALVVEAVHVDVTEE